MKRSMASAGTFVLVLAAGVSAAQVTEPAPLVEGDSVILRGCIAEASEHPVRPRSLLAWAPGDLVFHGTIARSDLPPATPSDEPAPFTYWLDDEESLDRFVGEHVEITGELAGIEEGEVMVEEAGPVTQIHFRFPGGEEVALVPSAWLGPSLDDPEPDTGSYEVQVRRVDINAVQVLDACGAA